MSTLLPTGWKLPEAIVRRLGTTAGRPRAMVAEGHLLLILHAPPNGDHHPPAGRLFWRAPDGNWKATVHGAGSHALDVQLDELASRLEALDDQLDAATRADQIFALLQEIAPLHRCALATHAVLQQAREALPDAREIINFRDRAGEIDRAAEMAHKDAQHSLDFLIARNSEQLSERMYHMTVSAHRLNLLAALFFPVATLAAIFGMNLPHGLEETGTAWTFLAVLAVGLASGVLLTAIIAQRPAAPSVRRRTAKKNVGRTPPRDPFQRA